MKVINKNISEVVSKGPFPRGLMIAAFLVVLFWGIAQARPFLIPLCIAALLAFLMAPLVRIMRQHRVPEWVAITCSAVLLVLPFLSLGYLLVLQGQSMFNDFPKISATVNHAAASFGQGPLGQKLQVSKYLDLSHLSNEITSRAGQGISLAISGLGALLGAGSQLALVLLFSVLMLASRVHLRSTAEEILANAEGVAAGSMLNEVTSLIQRFLIARSIIVLIIALTDAIILAAFGVNYSLLMGVFLGLMTLIPAIGFILGVIPPIIVSIALGHSALSTLAMTGALFVMSIIEGNIFTPKMVGRKLNINALSTFVGLFGGGLLWGVWGMFLSIPVLGVIRIALSASPKLSPWGDLLAEKKSDNLITAYRVRSHKTAA